MADPIRLIHLGMPVPLALEVADQIGDAAVAGISPQSWADFQSEKYLNFEQGAVVEFGGVAFERDRYSNIAGLPSGLGWKPVGNVTPAHFDADPSGNRDSSGEMQSWAAYIDGRVGFIPDSAHYKISNELYINQNGTLINGLGTVEQLTWGYHPFHLAADNCVIDGPNVISTQPKTMFSESLANRYLGDPQRSRCCAVYNEGDNNTIRITMSGFVASVFNGGRRGWYTNVELSGATTTSVVLPDGARQASGYYVGSIIRIMGASDEGLRRIIAYNGSTNTATVNIPWSSAPNGSGRYICIWLARQNNTTLNIEQTKVDFGVLASWVNGIFIERLVTIDGEQTQQAAAPPHSLYVTGDSEYLRSRNAVLGENMTLGHHGSAYKFRGVDGIVTAVLQADRCRGIASFDQCTNVVSAGSSGTNLGALTDGQPIGVHVTGGRAVHLGDVSAHFDTDYTGGGAATSYFPVAVAVNNDLDNSGTYAITDGVTADNISARWDGTGHTLYGLFVSRVAGGVINPANTNIRVGNVEVEAGSGGATGARFISAKDCQVGHVYAVATGGTVRAAQFDADANNCRAGYDPDQMAANTLNTGANCEVFSSNPAEPLTVRPQGQLTGAGSGMQISAQGGGVIGLTSNTFQSIANNIRWRNSGTNTANLWTLFSESDSATNWLGINPNGNRLRFGGTALNVENAAGAIAASVLQGGGFRVGGSTGPTVTSGAGDPDGLITAPVGSLYLRTDGGASTSMYVKESGASNTGWVAK